MFTFPCFRDKKWMKENGSNMKYPDAFLNVNFRPQFLRNYEHTVNFEERADQVIRQIKSALFRQAIYKVKRRAKKEKRGKCAKNGGKKKIQNVEVVAMHECKEDRVLESITKVKGYEKIKLQSSKVLSDELWTIKRCDRKMSYWVRYYEQDQNGYSLSIMPTQVRNILGFLKYYYF